VKALGVDHIATLAAADVTEDIVTRIPRTEGFVEKLARPARDVELLIGMDNQGWMPVHVDSSQLASDNLHPDGKRQEAGAGESHSGERRRRTGSCQEETRRLVARRHGSNGDHDAAPAGGAAGMHDVPRL